jgi:ABC-type lipoprotein release transport system permease subunit
LVAASLLATVTALVLLNGIAMRFTMGAFPLRVDGMTVTIGCGVGLALGVLGALPPALRAFRLPIVDGLRSF